MMLSTSQYPHHAFAQHVSNPAQWGFKWSQNAEHALPFVAISTSPYMKGDCCTDGDVVYRSTIDNNTWKPVDYPQGWEVVE